MGEKATKICLIALNVVALMAGITMLAGGIVIEYTNIITNVLKTLNSVVTSSQLGALGVVLVALGALVILITFVGCCGAISMSRCMLTLYFVLILILFLCQVGVFVAAFLLGSQTFYDIIKNNLELYVNSYGGDQTEKVVVDTVQQVFDCCGYDGPEDYRQGPTSTVLTPSSNDTTSVSPTMTTMNMSDHETTTLSSFNTSIGTVATFLMGNWPDTCCKTLGGEYLDLNSCHNTSLPLSQLESFVYTEGCTAAIEQWVQQNLILVGGIAVAIAVIELLAMIAACSLRQSLD